MLIRTIKDYKDKETKEIFRTTDSDPREVSEERGTELINLGYAIEVKPLKKKTSKNKTEETSEKIVEELDVIPSKPESSNAE